MLSIIAARKIAASFILWIATLSVSANIRLPKIFGDNMVMQRDQPSYIWGWADPKEKITVRFHNQVKKTTADKSGKWKITLDPETAGGPFQINIAGKNAINISNVLVGDVWVCSGQSNMEWTLRNSNNAQQEINEANYPQIRHFKVPNTVATEPKDDISGGEWKICSPGTAADFTAVGYFFARELVKELNVPIGLLNTSWGGTHSETWTSREAFENSDEFRTMISGMPKLNLDSIAKQRTAATRKRIEGLQGPMENSAGEVATWRTANISDNNWPVMKVPGLWEQQPPGELDGVVWLRKTFEVSAGNAGKEAVIDLSTIDDADETYVNGTRVGATNGYNVKRKYTIPAGTLKEGRNIIAVKVLDTGGGGGIYGDAADVKITIGGTSQSLSGDWKYKVESLTSAGGSPGPNSYPTLLFNAMVNPLIPFAMKGVIWYQGESNAGRAYQYRQAFPLMISDWRKHWKQGDFPFYFVQLASFNANNGDSRKGSGWAELREAQTMTLQLPNTGMAVTTDIGEPKDIHPRNKQDVGKRLALVALNKTYGRNIPSSGPIYQSMKVDGNRVVLTFSNVGGGLVAKDKYGYLKGFEIAGSDQQFQYAKAMIDGDNVIVFQEGIANPLAVRFGWADDASETNLFNKEGLPAVPFRTDNWKASTSEAKYRIGF
jgi:sialate O-acetylesterase